MQAQFAANLGKFETHMAHSAANLDKLTTSVADLAAILKELIRISDDRFTRLDERFARFDDQFAKLADAQKASDDRLNALFTVVERHISGHSHAARAGFQTTRRRGRERKVAGESVERGADSCLVILRSGKRGPSRARWKFPTLKTRLAIACGRGSTYDVAGVGVHDGNSG